MMKYILNAIWEIYKETFCNRNWKDISKLPAESEKVRMHKNYSESKLENSLYVKIVKMRKRKIFVETRKW